MKAHLQQRYGIETANQRPLIALAPMAGVTDVPFRELCETLGADYSVTEMAASAPQLLDSHKNLSRLHFTQQARVKILQIIGHDAEQMANAARAYAEQGCDIIDINLGCPAKKVSRKGAGSALLSDLPLVARILSAVTTACPVPVTLKTRLGPDHNDYTLLTVAEMALERGIELMTVHGRTRACRFNGKAQFTEIAKLKHTFPELSVIANGDISDVATAEAVFNETACDGLMIGRAAVGNPWLFSDIRRHFDAHFSPQPLEDADKNVLMLTHIRRIHDFYPAGKGVRFARKHIQAYLRQRGLADAFTTLANIDDAEAQRQQFAHLLSISPTLPLTRYATA